LAVGTPEAGFVIEVATGLRLHRVALPWVSDVRWMDDETVLVGTSSGVFGTLSLSTADCLPDVRAGLRRTFTDQQCAISPVDPCQTLPELLGDV
jgi:hypothetical protein